jgi:hypothetical protein
MADWKQITARIRRARTGKDPVGQLSNLYEKTRDAMVAFELARYFETAGQNPEAAKWYLAAADRFRRADWKTKAQEAAARLGAEVSAADPAQSSGDFMVSPPAIAGPEHDSSASQSGAEPSAAGSESSSAGAEPESDTGSAAAESEDAPDKKRRRRGRRGGRNRRKGEPSKTPAVSASRTPDPATPRKGLPPNVFDEAVEPRPSRAAGRAIPVLPVEPIGEPGGPAVRGRSGDPGLSSRLSLLEMQLRRLLTCPPVKLSEADHAPVGPGVFVLTDSDLTSYYYVEACQTLRIAVGNLLRGGASRRGTDSLKPQLAEHLGIPESRVTKYLADHCVVRWLQLDEGASHFAHFVTAVLRPTLNE